MLKTFFALILNLKNYLVSHIKLISIVLIASLLIFHFWSLAIYPIPWFDETLFASIGKDFFDRGHLFPWVAPFSYKFHECVTYGPVYFAIQAASYAVLGFNSFASRFSGFLFGVMMVCLFIQL